VVTTNFPVDGVYDNIPIGRPISNNRIYILDKNGNIQSTGVPGELSISGTGLAWGYLNNVELTFEKFAKNPFVEKERMYRTGDLALWLPDGNIEFLGRIDQQVKIRGNRIEPGEIEAQLLSHDLVKEVVIAVEEEEGNGNNYLCAYWVPVDADADVADADELKEFDGSKLRDYLFDKLPDYMIPSYFVSLNQIPLTPNGKVDREALPDPKVEVREYIPPANEREKELVNIWAEVLNLETERISVEVSFFRLGGHSLKATMLVAKIYETFNIKVPLVKIFKMPTIRGIANYIRDSENSMEVVQEDKIVLLKRKSPKARNLFFIHDGSGEVEGYLEFCHLLKNEFNCWGIRSDRVDYYGPGNLSFQEIAEKYIGKIKEIQPHGPYYIAGWSIGGTIGFEIVRQMETSMNEKIAFFSIIDSVPPKRRLLKIGEKFSLRSEMKYIQYSFPGIRFNKKILKKASGVEELWVAFIDELEKNNCDPQTIEKAIVEMNAYIIPAYARRSIPKLIQYLNVGRTLTTAWKFYAPAGKINTPIYYFGASQTEWINKERWNGYTTKSLKFQVVTGDHFSIFRKPHVKPFVRKFCQELDRCENCQL
jgi:thioesterase domain-containing protein/acyl carrier protein